VVAQTPMFVPSFPSGTSRTIARVLSEAKKSLGVLSHSVLVFGPRPSVPRNPRRSKKNGSERTPVQSLPSPTLTVLPVAPRATTAPLRLTVTVCLLPGPLPGAPNRNV
jgi:hypothetical protein